MQLHLVCNDETVPGTNLPVFPPPAHFIYYSQAFFLHPTMKANMATMVEMSCHLELSFRGVGNVRKKKQAVCKVTQKSTMQNNVKACSELQTESLTLAPIINCKPGDSSTSAGCIKCVSDTFLESLKLSVTHFSYKCRN
ncbi:hypothetical protein GOODEAATRI_028240 [Goodea atripinnis]|uniref:Uncharacterized protein n=1 Tax=Goodea atripinnis TaxID=208336 RepID=A0ABV0NNW0_9TELE